jgi:hypothetical protein
MIDLPTPENTITRDTFEKPKPHPLIASLPDYLKDRANYEKIEKAILDAGATKHSHGEMVDWAGCKACQAKQIDRLRMMKKLGFKNAAQYMTWKKIHQEIKARVPLPKYNT